MWWWPSSASPAPSKARKCRSANRGFRVVIAPASTCQNPKRPLSALLRQQAAEFLEPRLGRQDSAAVFFQQHNDDRSAQRAISGAFDEAAPILASAPKSGHGVEIAVMAVPAGPNGDRFRRLAQDALPDENAFVQNLVAPFSLSTSVSRPPPLLVSV